MLDLNKYIIQAMDRLIDGLGALENKEIEKKILKREQRSYWASQIKISCIL